jgi:hypothetical protein
MSTKIVWAQGTLPREETELDIRGLDGMGIAATLAKVASDHGSELIARIVIIEPAEFAGKYHICVDYEPTFTAYMDWD